MRQRRLWPGTLRAGEAETQMRKQQSRLNSGTAVTGADEENRDGFSLAGSEGVVRMEMTDMDNTCDSFWEVERGTGATGAEGDFGAAQQAILQQCRPLQQHDFAADEVPDTAMTGYAARINPSSNTTAILVSFKRMPVL